KTIATKLLMRYIPLPIPPRASINRVAAVHLLAVLFLLSVALCMPLAAPASGAPSWIQRARLSATESGDGGLGSNVAISGDGSTIVVGAPAYNGAGHYRGAVYVYERPAGGWSTATSGARLTPSNEQDDSEFGWRLAVSQNGSTIVVSYPRISEDIYYATI